MASSNLQIVIQAKDEFSHVLNGMTKPISGLVSSLGAIGLASVGIDSITGAFKDFISEALYSQGVQSQLNAVLKSTHGVAGMSADAINGLADSLSKITPFDDEAIGSAENLLLTFTNIGKDVFPQATEAILNMSQSLGQDLKSSSIQLGKALNDPIKGITALSRVGVSFTQTQKDMIAQMVKAGNTVGAQKIILKELDTEFGNSAKAAGETFAGKLSILQTQIGNVKEAIGGPLLTVLGNLMTQFTPLITQVAEGLPDALATVQATLTDFVPRVVKFGNDVVAAFSGFIKSGDISQMLADLNDYFLDAFDMSPGDILAKLEAFAAPVVAWIQGEIPIIRDQMLLWGKEFTAWISDAAAKIPGEATQIYEQVRGWIIDQIPKIRSQVQGWVDSFLGWAKDVLPRIPDELDKIKDRAFTWISEQTEPLRKKVGEWGDSFIGWVKDVIPKIPGELENLGKAALTWITDEIPKIQEQIKDWTKALSDWVAPAIPIVTVQLDTLGANVLTWINANSAPILAGLSTWATQFGNWIPGATIEFLKKWPGILNSILDAVETGAGPFASALVTWIWDALPKFALALLAINAAIITFIAETAITIGLRLWKWGQAFQDWIPTQIPFILTQLAKLGQAILDWIVDETKTLGQQAFNLGQNIVNEMISGVRSIQLPSLSTIAGSVVGSGLPPSTGSSGGVVGGDVHVHIYGDQSNPAAVQSAATTGVLAAQRAMGY